LLNRKNRNDARLYKRKAIVEIDEKLKKLRIAISNTKNPELAQEFEEEWEII